MSLNYDKCEIMHIYSGKAKEDFDFKLGGVSLKYTDSYKYLGVYIHRNEKWDKHIHETCNKGRRTLFVVKKVLRKSRPTVNKIAYYSLVRPILEYASSVWDPSHVGLIHNLEMIQRNAARFCSNKYGRTESVTEMIKELEWSSWPLGVMQTVYPYSLQYIQTKMAYQIFLKSSTKQTITPVGITRKKSQRLNATKMLVTFLFCPDQFETGMPFQLNLSKI